MSERHGADRLNYLLEIDPQHEGRFEVKISRLQLHSDREVMVEVALALIEELHDALLKLDHPLMIINNPVGP